MTLTTEEEKTVSKLLDQYRDDIARTVHITISPEGKISWWTKPKTEPLTCWTFHDQRNAYTNKGDL
jgi:hypothetical protein